MKNLFYYTAFLGICLLSSCDLAVGIFKAGAYTGIFIVVAIIALIVFLLAKFRGKN